MLTPIEIAQSKAAYNTELIALGFARAAIVQNLILDGDKFRKLAMDSTIPMIQRSAAMSELREINDALSVVAVLLDAEGISA